MISRSLMGDPVQRGADRPREAPLAETEATNLVPEPYRGKCNELASVVHTLEITWRRDNLSGPTAQIAANARRVFSPSSRSSSIEIARIAALLVANCSVEERATEVGLNVSSHARFWSLFPGEQRLD